MNVHISNVPTFANAPQLTKLRCTTHGAHSKSILRAGEWKRTIGRQQGVRNSSRMVSRLKLRDVRRVSGKQPLYISSTHLIGSQMLTAPAHSCALNSSVATLQRTWLMVWFVSLAVHLPLGTVTAEGCTKCFEINE